MSHESDTFENELEDQDDGTRNFSLRGLVRAVKNFRQERKDGMRFDILSFRPLHDRPSPISTTASADGAIGTLARIELNARAGRPLDDGLSPDALNQPNAP